MTATHINLERKQPVQITEQDRATTITVLLGIVDGVSEDDRRNWRRALRMMIDLDPGDMMGLDVSTERYGPFHRRHMAMESEVFKSQELFDDFNAGFRPWLKIGAGYVDWKEVDGKLTPEPKSTSYEDCDEIAFREFHQKSVTFLRSPETRAKLWPHITDRARIEMIEGLLGRA